MLGSAADMQMMPGKGWRGSVGACDEKKLPNKWGASELRAEPKYIEQCCEPLSAGSGKSKQSSPEFPTRAFLSAGKLVRVCK